jgi:hypothetical protein
MGSRRGVAGAVRAHVCRLLVVGLLTWQAACTFQGPESVVDESGPKSASVAGSYGRFRAIYDQAIADANSPTPDRALAYRLVDAGVNLEYQLCMSFFASAGKEQQNLLFSKEVIAAVATITTGALGAARVSPSSIAWVGLGSAAAVTGINIYARNFLFSEDNVHAVQELVMRALSNARDQALADAKRNSYNFYTAIAAIMDVQSICEVHNVLALVRDAIKNGQIQSTSTESVVAPALQHVVQAQLGKLVNKGTPLTDTELEALYWLFRDHPRPSTAELKATVYPMIAGLDQKPIDVNGNPVATFPRDGVAELLSSLPPTVVTQLQTHIATLRAPPAPAPGAVPGPAGAPAVAVAPAPPRVLALPPLSAPSAVPGRISVGVKPLR